MQRMLKMPGVPSSGKENLIPVLRKPAVAFQPKTYKVLQHGVDLIANAVRPTLGPLPRLVALERVKRVDAPEFLDDGATIARRITWIKPRGQDVGAMLIRHAMWKMHDEVGDGTTTMAVMFQTILREGIRYVTEYQCNAMTLRSGLEKGLMAVQESIHANTISLKGRQSISAIAMGMCQSDREMANILGEIFDILGPEGMIEIEGWNRLELEREYIEGTYWKLSGVYSREFLPNIIGGRTVFEDAAILITDLNLKEPSELIPVLEKCVKAGVKKLVILAGDCSDRVLGLLVKNNQAKTIDSMAVRTPRISDEDRVEAMDDIAVLTGGRVFYRAAGNTLEDFKVEDLGHVRRAWAGDSLFGFYGGKGDPRLIRQQIAKAQRQLKQIDRKEEFKKEQAQMRIGRLLGGTALLYIGGIHENLVEARKEVARRAVIGLRQALRGGVVPGGGVALLNARAALADLPAENEETAIAYQILSRALEEPLRVIAKNAGYQPDVILERMRSAPQGFGFDALSGQIVDMQEHQILDAVLVLDKALEMAVSGAAITLTTDVIIHHRKPVEDPANP